MNPPSCSTTSSPLYNPTPTSKELQPVQLLHPVTVMCLLLYASDFPATCLETPLDDPRV